MTAFIEYADPVWIPVKLHPLIAAVGLIVFSLCSAGAILLLSWERLRRAHEPWRPGHKPLIAASVALDLREYQNELDGLCQRAEEQASPARGTIPEDDLRLWKKRVMEY